MTKNTTNLDQINNAVNELDDAQLDSLAGGLHRWRRKIPFPRKNPDGTKSQTASTTDAN